MSHTGNVDANDVPEFTEIEYANPRTNQNITSCGVCLGLDRQTWRQKKRARFEYSNAKAAAETGCQVCRCICTVVDHFFTLGKPLPHRIHEIFSVDFSPEGPVVIWIDRSPQDEVMIYSPQAVESKTWNFLKPFNYEIASSAGNDEAFALISGWMHNCIHKIDWAELPRTFQDAIIVTRKLGLRYLWVDALCIVQDDETDWQIESSRMGAYYSSAHVVIAASSSSDSSQSFLAPRRTKPLVRTGLSFNPLDARAWTFQEQYLAKRLLCYTEQELRWTCRATMSCECGFEHQSSQNDSLSMKFMGRYCMQLAWIGNPQFTFQQWQGIIFTYTKRHLTKRSDKLPAVAGIAAIVHEITGSSYLAGLWKDNIISDLSWHTQTRQIRRTTSDTLDELLLKSSSVMDFWDLRAASSYLAPSFSWASIDLGAVEYGGAAGPCMNNKSDAVLVDAKCTPKGANPLGEVEAGFIMLKAQIIEAELTASDVGANRFQFTVSCNGMQSPLRADLPLVIATGLTASGKEVTTVKRATIADTLEAFTGPVYCLALCHLDNEAVSIVLGRSETIAGGYERIGIVRLKDDIEYPTSHLKWYQGAEERVIKIF